MGSDDQIKVEVAYAQPDGQVIIPVDIESGANIDDAINLSGILGQFPSIDLTKNKVGIFGKLAKLDRELRSGDRIEIYRALIADPKEVRRRRAAEAKDKAAKEAAASESDKKT